MGEITVSACRSIYERHEQLIITATGTHILQPVAAGWEESGREEWSIVVPPGILIVRSFAEAAGVYHAAFSPSRSVLMSVRPPWSDSAPLRSIRVFSVYSVMRAGCAVALLGWLRGE